MVLAMLAWIPVVKSTDTEESTNGEAASAYDAETIAAVPDDKAEKATTTTTSPTSGSDEESPLPPVVDEAASPLPKEIITDEQAEPPKKPKRLPDVDDFFNIRDHTDWGTYYDPQNVFCGKFDCYKILGFDYESFGKKHPDRKVITKRYRSLSREWHPDKSKHKDAKERFVVRTV
jgi:DnaJ domain